MMVFCLAFAESRRLHGGGVSTFQIPISSGRTGWRVLAAPPLGQITPKILTCNKSEEEPILVQRDGWVRGPTKAPRAPSYPHGGFRRSSAALQRSRALTTRGPDGRLDRSTDNRKAFPRNHRPVLTKLFAFGISTALTCSVIRRELHLHLRVVGPRIAVAGRADEDLSIPVIRYERNPESPVEDGQRRIFGA
jgi:hypothetical protein